MRASVYALAAAGKLPTDTNLLPRALADSVADTAELADVGAAGIVVGVSSSGKISMVGPDMFVQLLLEKLLTNKK